MPNKYERLPTSDSPSSLPPYSPYKSESEFDDDVELNGSLTPLFDVDSDGNPRPRDEHSSQHDNLRTRDTREAIRAFHADPRFHPPQPSVYARAGLLIFMFTMFWLAYGMRKAIWFDFGMGETKTYEQPDASY
ncbi:hypothetical protein BKA70DRAFT_1167397 [Coprinopsis sp. MPI-PUGE-AT-0042]|nr:hypothetical protein BKA70DRAFT_1167397 [Coprinopsis sp. MPI-PUGE-AT-0042]